MQTLNWTEYTRRSSTKSHAQETTALKANAI